VTGVLLILQYGMIHNADDDRPIRPLSTRPPVHPPARQGCCFAMMKGQLARPDVQEEVTLQDLRLLVSE
jgi:hypothetical protein